MKAIVVDVEGRSEVATVEEQHETFAAFRQNLTDAFGDLKQQLDGATWPGFGLGRPAFGDVLG